MFRRLPDASLTNVEVELDGERVSVPAGVSVAAALLNIGAGATRTTPVRNAPRAPYCMMGVCFECLMEIDDQPNRQACMIPVTAGMRIKRQRGAPTLNDA